MGTMIKNEFNALDVKESVATGDSMNVEDFSTDKGVQVHGTFAATVQVQFSVNGSDFEDVGAALTAPAYVPIPAIAKRVRVDTTAFTSGNPAATLGGSKLR